MQVMGTNRWERDIDRERVVKEALKFSDYVAAEGIAHLREAYIAVDEKMIWCSWDTENRPALEAAFVEMNRQSGLMSELTPVEAFYP